MANLPLEYDTLQRVEAVADTVLTPVGAVRTLLYIMPSRDAVNPSKKRLGNIDPVSGDATYDEPNPAYAALIEVESAVTPSGFQMMIPGILEIIGSEVAVSFGNALHVDYVDVLPLNPDAMPAYAIFPLWRAWTDTEIEERPA